MLRNTSIVSKRHNQAKQAFTLIELSIVMVIIGLIVGSVMVAQDLIGAASVRAQIDQIEKYTSAMRTFQLKYGFLPGDIPEPAASSLGFAARYPYAGAGDGNGTIEGLWRANNISNGGTYELNGETEMFWVDLSVAKLINQTFSIVNLGNDANSYTTASDIAKFLPQAKLNSNNNIYVYSENGINYFGLSSARNLTRNVFTSRVGLTVAQAAMVDSKMDDGFPQTGWVIAKYINNDDDCCGSGTGIVWASGVSEFAVGAFDTSATNGNSGTCYDNGGNNGTRQSYSMGQGNGEGVNCALTFRIQ